MFPVKETSNNDRGFSLLELSLSLIIIGVLVAPFLLIYNNYEKNRRENISINNVQLVVDSLQNFRRMNGEYPCPAGIRLPRNSENNGRPDETACGGAAASGLANGGNCKAEGVCLEWSQTGFRRVIVGAVPFRALQLDESKTLDHTGARLVYAVTEGMTDQETLNDNEGGISILNEAGTFAVSSITRAAFVVLSTGPSGAGAITSHGTSRSNCPAIGTTLDAENCNPGFHGGAGSQFATYRTTQRNEAAGNNFFDDYIMYFSQVRSEQWRRSDANNENAYDLSPDFVGIGVNNALERLHINSGSGPTDPAIDPNNPALSPLDRLRLQDSLRIEGGKLFTDRLCDQNGANCFDLIKILGDYNTPGEGMKCPKPSDPPNARYMKGIQNGEPICESQIDIVCDDDRTRPVLVGRDPSGALRCETLPALACTAGPANLCSPGDVTLPSLYNTQVTRTFESGDCKRARYRCNNGNWEISEQSGECSFTAGPPVRTCGVACGQGSNDTFCTTVTPRCGGGEILSSSTFNTDCTCTGGVFPETQNCTAPFLGTETRTVTLTPTVPPSANCTRSETTWTGCACSVPPVTTEWVADPTQSCGPGLAPDPTRPFQVERRFNTTRCLWEEGARRGGPCICDTTPISNEIPPVCPDICQEPDDNNIFQITIDASTCTQNPPVLTRPGTCRARSFTWSSPRATGNQAGSLPPNANFVGRSCSCADHRNTSRQACFFQNDPNRAIYTCDCL